MALSGPIVILDDDDDDILFYRNSLTELNYTGQIESFNNVRDALIYLKDPNVFPFILIVDLRMPKMTGLQFQQCIENDPSLKRKCIPVVLLSGVHDDASVVKAYQGNIHGYFLKPCDSVKITECLKTIITYWKMCIHPDIKRSSQLEKSIDYEAIL